MVQIFVRPTFVVVSLNGCSSDVVCRPERGAILRKRVLRAGAERGNERGKRPKIAEEGFLHTYE